MNFISGGIRVPRGVGAAGGGRTGSGSSASFAASTMAGVFSGGEESRAVLSVGPYRMTAVGGGRWWVSPPLAGGTITTEACSHAAYGRRRSRVSRNCGFCVWRLLVPLGPYRGDNERYGRVPVPRSWGGTRRALVVAPGPGRRVGVVPGWVGPRPLRRGGELGPKQWRYGWGGGGAAARSAWARLEGNFPEGSRWWGQRKVSRRWLGRRGVGYGRGGGRGGGVRACRGLVDRGGGRRGRPVSVVIIRRLLTVGGFGSNMNEARAPVETVGAAG